MPPVSFVRARSPFPFPCLVRSCPYFGFPFHLCVGTLASDWFQFRHAFLTLSGSRLGFPFFIFLIRVPADHSPSCCHRRSALTFWESPVRTIFCSWRRLRLGPGQDIWWRRSRRLAGQFGKDVGTRTAEYVLCYVSNELKSSLSVEPLLGFS